MALSKIGRTSTRADVLGCLRTHKSTREKHTSVAFGHKILSPITMCFAPTLKSTSGDWSDTLSIGNRLQKGHDCGGTLSQRTRVARRGPGGGGLCVHFSPACTQRHAPRDQESNAGAASPVKNSLLARLSYAHEIRLGLATDASSSAVQWIALLISWERSKK